MGMPLPVHTVRTVLLQLRERGKGRGGADDSGGKIVLSVEPVPPQVRKSLGLEASVDGLYVNHVKEVSPAFDAGLRDGDVITQVNGRTVNSTEEFARIVKGTSK